MLIAKKNNHRNCWKANNILLFSLLLLTLNNCYSQRFVDTMVIKNLQQSNEVSRLQIQNLSREINELKLLLQKQQHQGFDKFSAASLFLDAAISSANNLQTLILKESYRNKIASLNNPTSNDLGFNLEIEIQNALKPLLQKTKKTNSNKFGQVVGSFLQTGKSSPLSLFPAGNVFTSILGMVGNLTVQEKGIEKEDLDKFINTIEKYFSQYQRLYQCNVVFNADMEKLKTRLILLQEDIKNLLHDLILAMDKSLKRQQLKSMSIEELMLRNFDNRKIQEKLSRPQAAQIQFPADAVKTCKEIANSIQRIYDEYSAIYSNNFKEIKNIISDTKTASITVDQLQLTKTLRDVEAMYNESKNIDAGSLRLKTLFERLETIIQ